MSYTQSQGRFVSHCVHSHIDRVSLSSDGRFDQGDADDPNYKFAVVTINNSEVFATMCDEFADKASVSLHRPRSVGRATALDGPCLGTLLLFPVVLI